MSTMPVDLLPLEAWQRIDCRDEADWREVRRQGIGASEAPVVMGVSRYKTPLSLYAEKLELVEPDAKEREWLTWGRLLEPVIADHYATQTGRRLVDLGPHTVLRSRAIPFMQFTPDRLILGDPRGLGGVQIKCAAFFKAEEWDEEPPLEYQIQAQQEMAVTGAAWWSLAVLIGGNTFRWCDIERNERFIAALTEAEREFFGRLLRQEPPLADGHEATREVLRAMYPQHLPGLVVNLPGEAVEWDQQRTLAAEQIATYSALKEEADNRIKQAIGEAEAGCLSNGVMFTWKSSPRKGYAVAPTTVRTLRRTEAKS